MKKSVLSILLLVTSLLFLFFVLIIFYPPVKVFCWRELSKATDLSLQRVFEKNLLKSPFYEIEARFSPGFVTIKCMVESEASKDISGFQPFLLYRNFKIDSVKLNQRDLKYERWFNYGEATIWKIYLPELKEGEKIQLFFIYSGRVPQKSNNLYYCSPDLYWYPQPPGVTEAEITFRCITNNGWEPLIAGVSTSVAELKEEVLLYDFHLQPPFSLIIKRKQEAVSSGENGDKFRFYSDLPGGTLPGALLEKTAEFFSYLSEKFGNLPVASHYYLFTKAGKSGGSTLYGTVTSLGEGSGFKRDPEDKAVDNGALNLAEGITRAWWGGAVRPDQNEGAALIEGLARYSSYLLIHDLISPERAGELLDNWYQGYLLARKRYGRYEKSLAEIIPFLDWQEELSRCKAPLIWHSLRYILGEREFLMTLKRFYEEFSGRSVKLSDFQTTAEETGRVDLDWFFAYFLYSRAGLDLMVEEVQSVEVEDGFQATVLIRHRENGKDFRGRVMLRIKAGEESLEETVEIHHNTGEVTVRTNSPLTSVILDPERKWPDINRSNNVWSR